MLLLLRARLAPNSCVGGREQPARGAASLQAMLAALLQPMRPHKTVVSPAALPGCLSRCAQNALASARALGGVVGAQTAADTNASDVEAPKWRWLVGQSQSMGRSAQGRHSFPGGAAAPLMLCTIVKRRYKSSRSSCSESLTAHLQLVAEHPSGRRLRRSRNGELYWCVTRSQ